MNKLKTILAPSDLSDFSKPGFRYALELAQWQQSEVVICNVITVEETPFPQGKEDWVAKQLEVPKMKKIVDQRAKFLDRYLRENFADLLDCTNIRREIRVGTPYQVIVEMATAEAVDIIVMSTHGRTGLAHMLLGSVTERVLRRAPCPVLAVPLPKKAKRSAKRPAV
jgi:nucleotide-binding universal stress UspA family protein